jgi:hypothetical protein
VIFVFNKTFSDAEMMNLQENKSRLELSKLFIEVHEHTTIWVLFKNRGFLTQRMASAGAQDFLAAAIYTMTERLVITTMNFDSPRGNHVAPGLYARMSFTDYRTVYTRK